MCVDLLVGTQVLGLLRWNPLSRRTRGEKFNTCGHCQSVIFLDFRLDALSVCNNSDLPSDESGILLYVIVDSGAEEHVVSLADWKSLGEPVLETCSSSIAQCGW